MTRPVDQWRDPRVAVVELAAAAYPRSSDGNDEVSRGVSRLADLLGWSGGRETGAFGPLIPEGAQVVVKPNWVMDRNQGPWGIEPLLTHASLVRAVVESVLRANPSRVVVGDAPLQACDFSKLLATTELDRWGEALQAAEPRFAGIRDFRRTTCVVRGGIRVPEENRLPRENFVLFDLGAESLLEPVTDGRGSFRVTQYDPSQMVVTHGPGRHQYLVAKELVDADVVFNLPKLKTHKKAGLTCALKNLIGINGNKEYLPHHRVGGSGRGGDCYPGRSPVKRVLEYAFDRQNSTTSRAGRHGWYQVTHALGKLVRMTGDELGVEGSWSGNDTVWRTCLDLNRIALYGRADGSLAAEPQRAVFHIVDAVVAGQGDGPLAAQPLPLRLLLAAASAPAIDWVAAQLLGYAPERIPIVREAFGDFRWPIASFAPDEVVLLGEAGRCQVDELRRSRMLRQPVIYPVGWRDAVAR